MSNFIAIMMWVCLIILIIGLIKPELVLRTQKYARLKILGLWLLSVFITGTIGSQIERHALSKMTSAELMQEWEKDNKPLVIELMKKIPSEDSLYNEVQSLVREIEVSKIPQLSSVEFRTHYTIIDENKNTVTLINGDGASNVFIPKEVIDNDKKYTVIAIGDNAFINRSSLKSVTIPNTVSKIGVDAFADCSSLTSVVLPDSIKEIKSGAFRGCRSLTSVTIPNGVKIIKGYAFKGCSSLTSVTIPNSVTIINDNAFEDCSSLTSVVLPDSIKEIESSIFRGCSSLTSVTIPNGVTTIRGNAFRNCKGLTSFQIPASVTQIGESAFADCNSLISVQIPALVTDINSGTFSRCSNLTSVMLPNSIKRIYTNAFKDCRSLTSIAIPNSVTRIADDAFEGCDNFTAESAAKLKKRMDEIKALKVEVVMRQPTTVYAYTGYYTNGSSTSVWKWTISFSAKNNKGGFTLRSSSYTITNSGKTWTTGSGQGNTINGYSTITVEKGKSYSYEQEFHGESFRGGVYERSWSGEDEYGNPITVNEKVLLR